MKRLRLSLGPRQTERLLLALSYAIDTFSSDPDEEDRRLGTFEARTIREWEELQEAIRREKARQLHGHR